MDSGLMLPRGPSRRLHAHAGDRHAPITGVRVLSERRRRPGRGEKRADLGDTQIWVGSSDAGLEPKCDATYDRPVALTENSAAHEPTVGAVGRSLPAREEVEARGCANNRLDRRAVLIDGQH